MDMQITSIYFSEVWFDLLKSYDHFFPTKLAGPLIGIKNLLTIISPYVQFTPEI